MRGAIGARAGAPRPRLASSVPRDANTAPVPASVPLAPLSLQVFNCVPKGCALYPISDDYSVPHLCAGPFVGWWSGPLVRARSIEEVDEEIREGRIGGGCVDGPRLVDHMREALCGRVIGVFRTSGDGVLSISSDDATMPRLAAAGRRS
jgi:hypothetical protein